MKSRNFLHLINKLWICLFLSLLFTSGQLNAQPGRLELHRIWAVDLDREVTALRLADLDGDGTNEIFVGLSDGDSAHIEIFNGSNGILNRTSDRIRSGRIMDMDAGDIDGDGDLEVVLAADVSTYWSDWYGSLVGVLDAQGLRLEWQGIIGLQILTCVEVEDMDQDNTAEVFIGSYNWSYETAFSGPKRALVKLYEGALYCLDGTTKALYTEEVLFSWNRFVVEDVDHDSYKEIVCGNTFTRLMQFMTGRSYYLRQAWLSVIDQDGSRYDLSTLFATDFPFFDDFDPPHVRSMAIGDCDSDDNKEIASYLYAGRDYFYDDYWNRYYAGPPEYILTITDASSGIVQKSISYPTDVVGLALFDVDAQPPDEILIAHSSGIIEGVNGMTFDTVAISDPLPAISFFAFGDVTGDAMPEICISDGDALFLYGFGPTGVEEQDEEITASEVVLRQNYPNPFNPQTTIKYYLFKGSRVELSIYNIKGQKVKTLVDGFQTVGFQSVTWDGTNRNGADVASGVYFYRVRTDYSQVTRKMVLIK